LITKAGPPTCIICSPIFSPLPYAVKRKFQTGEQLHVWKLSRANAWNSTNHPRPSPRTAATQASP
jgi:hypothetical protein